MLSALKQWFRNRRAVKQIAAPLEPSGYAQKLPERIHLHWHISDLKKIPSELIWNANTALVDDSSQKMKPTNLMPYDENLLEKARTQWQLGDWEGLMELERDTMQHHPDRAKLALLAAAGHMQQGDTQVARQFVRLAQDWGCSKKLISQILIAGVHNSLGRAAAISHQDKALNHFEKAVAIGQPGGDVRLIVQARINWQLSYLGLPKFDSHVTELIKQTKIGLISTARNPITKTIYHFSSDERIFIEGIEFTGFEKQPYGTTIGYADDFVIKIELFPHHAKRNSMGKEAGILQYLNECNCICVPKVHGRGFIGGKEYLIMERIHGQGECNSADVLFSFCALAGLGVIHADLAPTGGKFNHIHNGIYAILIDFDQSIIDDAVKKMSLEEIILYMDNQYPKLPGGAMAMQLEKWNLSHYLLNGRLDLSNTSLFKLGISTDTSTGIYHHIDGKKVAVNGERGIDERINVLSRLDFNGEVVLDVGANTGELTRFVARHAKYVDGIERCREHAIAGQLINSCEGVTNAIIQHLDAMDNWPRAEYDTVLLFSVLHHIEDMNCVIKKVSRYSRRVIIECSLKENGFAYIQGKWLPTNKWEFSTIEDLSEWLAKSFGMEFKQNHGDVDRNRYILEFCKK